MRVSRRATLAEAVVRLPGPLPPLPGPGPLPAPDCVLPAWALLLDGDESVPHALSAAATVHALAQAAKRGALPSRAKRSALHLSPFSACMSIS
jgi:hypothetical protein